MVEILCTRLHGPEFEMSLVSGGEGDMPATVAGSGVRVTSMALSTKRAFLAHVPELARLLRRESPDVVHLHGHFAASLGQLSLRLAGRLPAVYSVQWPAYLDDHSFYSQVRNHIAERTSCAIASRVVAVSEHDRRALVERRLCDPGKLTVIHNSYDSARFFPPPGEPSTERGRPIVGFVGRLADQKGVDYLLRAMPAVLGDHPGARLVIVGDGSMRRALEELASSLGLANGSVIFAGYQPVAAATFHQMAVVVVPSLYEPFGIVAVEAMACGRPVVASAVGGLPETVLDGTTGILVPPNDPGALAAAITRLLRSEPLRLQMGLAAVRRVTEMFSPEACVRAYADEYRLAAGSAG